MISLACLLAISGLSLLFALGKSGPPEVRLYLLNQTIEQGRPVADFRIVTANVRRIQIENVEKLFGDTVEVPFEFPGSARPATNFWAPGQGSILHRPFAKTAQFAVTRPEQVAAWKLRLTVLVEPPGQLDRIKLMPRAFRFHRANGRSFLMAARLTWTGFYNAKSETVESTWITNQTGVTPSE